MPRTGSTFVQLATAVTGSSTLSYAYGANGALLTRKLGNAGPYRHARSRPPRCLQGLCLVG
ncbi:hypothetical protein EOA33_31495 [Mesorhizobium sp. M4A.F.Ca.ET.050.02.1.1]|uniref:hypothetical protein n=1 Tax=Mesorhizobium sp. M4A.F.Ca.ET.050.02.1.1 TaxID=2496754 RepID=UPI000FCAB947|nr:hypothetical protein [Mesorhizobium sp. M4A.F.Ca.ET.050.02.1.1]RUX42597.1 hypothetical protein EOA33_31495 [Mesorhizobium sp. M4A.F.Ca.ET.050.02.1.1]